MNAQTLQPQHFAPRVISWLPSSANLNSGGFYQ